MIEPEFAPDTYSFSADHQGFTPDVSEQAMGLCVEHGLAVVLDAFAEADVTTLQNNTKQLWTEGEAARRISTTFLPRNAERLVARDYFQPLRGVLSPMVPALYEAGNVASFNRLGIGDCVVIDRFSQGLDYYYLTIPRVMHTLVVVEGESDLECRQRDLANREYVSPDLRAKVPLLPNTVVLTPEDDAIKHPRPKENFIRSHRITKETPGQQTVITARF